MGEGELDLNPAHINIEKVFPRLKSDGFVIMSPWNINYNCIAYAAEDSSNVWWPIRGTFWPEQAPNELTESAFVRAFKTIGYERCRSLRLARGYKKVVLYIDSSGSPTHMARQLPNGKWTSKLGESEDIQHNSVEGLGGTIYGEPKLVLRKRTSDPIRLFDHVANAVHELFCRWPP
jgi:hypothetical protein